MTDYTKTTNFTVKDTLVTGNPAKIIRGSEFDTEFNNIQVANNSKLDKTGGSLTGSLTVSGDVTASGSFNISSDIRLKEDIEEITESLEIIKDLTGYYYTRPDLEGSPEHVGVIAQEVLSVLPQAVNTEGEYLSVNYLAIIAVLINAVKELNARVESLEAK